MAESSRIIWSLVMLEATSEFTLLKPEVPGPLFKSGLPVSTAEFFVKIVLIVLGGTSFSLSLGVNFLESQAFS